MSLLHADRGCTLAIVSKESEKEFARLTAERKKGDLLYEPRAESLYVWQLETDREHVGHGYRDRSKHTDLYSTRDLAVRGACQEILRYWGDGSWSSEYREKLLAQMAAGQHEEAMVDFSTHHQALRFDIRAVEVRASAEPYEISEYKP
jgi:hypothetical protein